MTFRLSCIDTFTRTMKNMLFERVEHSGKDWHALLAHVISQCLNTTHSSTKIKPVDALKDNDVEVNSFFNQIKTL